jgi:hypothetical protein
MGCCSRGIGTPRTYAAHCSTGCSRAQKLSIVSIGEQSRCLVLSLLLDSQDALDHSEERLSTGTSDAESEGAGERRRQRARQRGAEGREHKGSAAWQGCRQEDTRAERRTRNAPTYMYSVSAKPAIHRLRSVCHLLSSRCERSAPLNSRYRSSAALWLTYCAAGLPHQPRVSDAAATHHRGARKQHSTITQRLHNVASAVVAAEGGGVAAAALARHGAFESLAATTHPRT